MKKKMSILLALVMLLSLFTITTYAANVHQERIQVGGNLSEFEVSRYFDSERGIIKASFNRTLINEAGIRVFHTTKSHYGSIHFSGRTNTTNSANAGDWTNRADVRVDSLGYADFYAYY